MQGEPVAQRPHIAVGFRVVQDQVRLTQLAHERGAQCLVLLRTVDLARGIAEVGQRTGLAEGRPGQDGEWQQEAGENSCQVYHVVQDDCIQVRVRQVMAGLVQ